MIFFFSPEAGHCNPILSFSLQAIPSPSETKNLNRPSSSHHSNPVPLINTNHPPPNPTNQTIFISPTEKPTVPLIFQPPPRTTPSSPQLTDLPSSTGRRPRPPTSAQTRRIFDSLAQIGFQQQPRCPLHLRLTSLAAVSPPTQTSCSRSPAAKATHCHRCLLTAPPFTTARPATG